MIARRTVLAATLALAACATAGLPPAAVPAGRTVLSSNDGFRTAGPSLSPNDELLNVPDNLLGWWVAHESPCSDEAGFDLLRVEERRLAFWESSGELDNIRRRSSGALAAIATMSEYEEDEWLVPLELELFATDLLVLKTEGGSTTYKRCATTDGLDGRGDG